MIITLLDETIDEEVWTIDMEDGPFNFMVEGDWSLDPGEWVLAWADVKGSEWAETLLGLEEFGNGFMAQLKYADPRFIEALLDAPVIGWKWLHYAPLNYDEPLTVG